MTNLIKKTILTGLGIVSLTKDKAEKLVKDLIKEGELSKSEGAKMTKDLLEKVEKNKENLENKIEKTTAKALAKLNVPTHKEITDLKKKIENLDKKLSKK